MQLPDVVIVQHCAQAMLSIVSEIPLEGLDIALLPRFVAVLNALVDSQALAPFASAVCSLSRDKRFAQAMLPNAIDFARIFFTEFQGSTGDIRRTALNIILNLLPDLDFPPEFWLLNNRTLARQDEFARQMQPFALRLLFAKAGRDHLVLAVIASTMLVQPLDVNDDLLGALLVYASSNDLAPYCLQIAKSHPNPSLFAAIVPLLRKATPDDKVKAWYAAALDAFAKRAKGHSSKSPLKIPRISSFEDLCKFLLAKPITPFQFQNSGLLARTLELLDKLKEIRPSLHEAAVRIIELVHGVLAFLPLPFVADPLSDFSPEQLLGKMVRAVLKIGDETVPDITIGMELDLSAIEAWYNNRKERTEPIVDTLQRGEYRDMLVIADPRNLHLTHTALLRRGLGANGNVRYHFVVNGQSFSALDCVFHAVGRSVPDIQKFNDQHLIELVEGDVPRAPLVIAQDIDPLFSNPIRILEIIHRLVPHVNIRSERFAKQIFHRLSSPVLTIGLRTAQSKLVYLYPFLFDFEMRVSFFRIVGFDLSYSLPCMNSFFNKVPWNDRANTTRVQCVIRRDNIFDDGVRLLRLAGPGMLRIDVQFAGEVGLGYGPTHEFFAKFSREFCLKSRKIWRDDGRDPVYASSRAGLFPAPDASPEMFYVLGLLCGKALLMDMLVPIPIGCGFWKLILGELISAADVDPEFASSLESPAGLISLPFVYPGYPAIELIKNGATTEVTERNVKQFVELVAQRTVDPPGVAAEFRRGLSAVVQWELLKLFGAVELAVLFGGNTVRITREELAENVIVSHGYVPKSKQIEMFFDVVSELAPEHQGQFVKFVTGSHHLPFNGLKGLNPKLTVALRTPENGRAPDETLPSVMTCANYFKLPAYSSKQVMRAKIITAITECQDSFLLT
jgi:E3 ubiquitin-protein ligase TRIP12